MSAASRLLGALGRDQGDIEAQELAGECGRAGCQRIADIEPREVVQVTGCVHSLAVRPRGSDPQLQVELYDGTGILTLIWLGRREIAGIAPGAFLTVRGRCTLVDGQPTMFNPAYHLLPRRG